MTRDVIISQLFTGKNFNDVIRKMEPEHLQDDLRMEVIAIVCEWPDDKIVGLYERKELDFYVVRVILNQIQSNSSPFYKKYRQAQLMYMEDTEDYAAEISEARRRHLSKVALRVNAIHKATSPEEIQERQRREDTEDRALAAIDDLYWYNREIVRLYQQHGNYRAIEKETRIPFISTYKTAQKAFKELKEKALWSTGT